MSTSRKRKMEDKEENNVMTWSNNKEACLHAERCFRKNPHHFREYNHPHLNIFLNGVIPDVLPKEYTQPRELYTEQIAIMKQLGMGSSTKKVNVQASSSGESSNNFSSSSKDVRVNTAPSSSNSTGKILLKLPPGYVSMEDKLIDAAPYNLFFTQIPEVSQTLNLKSSISFQDLLCPTLGRLKDSLQINFIIDIIWLMQEYYKSNYHRLPMTVLYGDDFPSVGKYIDSNLPNVKHQFVKLSDPFGTHHSKMGIYHYDDESIRVVISTANLYTEDWSIYNQCVWVSPKCPKLLDCANPKNSKCGPTGFKLNLIDYLKTYKFSCLDKWITLVENADFSSVNVFLVTSSPGYHKNGKDGCHMHRVGRLLSEHCTIPNEDKPGTLITQSSSLGSYGGKPADWLLGYFRQTLASTVAAPTTLQSLMTAASLPQIRLVYPSMQNVARNKFGEAGAGCLPYGQNVQDKQPWLNQYLCQWKADKLNRSAVMPHLKTYTRLSNCGRRLAYFLVTSANVSKAAWGTKPKANPDRTIYIRSYEAGILFLPKFFNATSFPLDQSNNEVDSMKPFPIMYDLPLTPYTDADTPWAR